MLPKDLKKPIVASLESLLCPLAYRKTGSTFSRPSNDVIHLIEVQGSLYNRSESARFTVNVAVFVQPFIDEDMVGFTKPSVAGSHWRQRLGFLSPRKLDLWWCVSTLDEADNAAYEISSMVDLCALPSLESLSSSQALVALWSNGSSPGITEFQREDYLKRLANLRSEAIRQ